MKKLDLQHPVISGAPKRVQVIFYITQLLIYFPTTGHHYEDKFSRPGLPLISLLLTVGHLTNSDVGWTRKTWPPRITACISSSSSSSPAAHFHYHQQYHPLGTNIILSYYYPGVSTRDFFIDSLSEFDYDSFNHCSSMFFKREIQVLL